MNPIEQISDLLGQLKLQNQLAPMCLSTISEAGGPNSRFVDLKEVSSGRLYFGTDERSTKAKEFFANPKVSICAWWESVHVQVRVVGEIEQAPDSIGDQVFSGRNASAKAIAVISCQSEELADFEELRSKISKFLERSGKEVDRPLTWHVYGIVPTEIEILRFSEDRIHKRTRYTYDNSSWLERQLSP